MKLLKKTKFNPFWSDMLDCDLDFIEMDRFQGLQKVGSH